jgi:hypothetical protein
MWGSVYAYSGMSILLSFKMATYNANFVYSVACISKGVNRCTAPDDIPDFLRFGCICTTVGSSLAVYYLATARLHPRNKRLRFCVHIVMAASDWLYTRVWFWYEYITLAYLAMLCIGIFLVFREFCVAHGTDDYTDVQAVFESALTRNKINARRNAQGRAAVMRPRTIPTNASR